MTICTEEFTFPNLSHYLLLGIVPHLRDWLHLCIWVNVMAIELSRYSLESAVHTFKATEVFNNDTVEPIGLLSVEALLAH
jgi:hypothetical protein